MTPTTTPDDARLPAEPQHPSRLLGTRPGKVVAVHLNYPSRAAQRGRTPAAPSYFLKPTSSLASSGEAVERPAGTELLAFEGEIALVIGREARRVTVEDAWSYVAGVTAANDWGVYDLRTVDKGSNLRNKGADGFTPLGPAVLDASALDPAALRVRTWKNGELVQDDTTRDLLFPFAVLVSDLSQLLTLEPGDVILTGTPAGASVAGPGDVVEVEVDAPDAAGSPSTGRLVSRVVQGEVPLPPHSAQPTVDDAQRTEAWGSREAAGLAPVGSGEFESGAVGAPPHPGDPAPSGTAGTPGNHAPSGTSGAADDEVRALLAAAPVAAISAQLRKRGLNAVHVDGVHPLRPGARMVGRARTLRFVPGREDLFRTHGGGYNAQKRAFDSLRPGDVLVIEARGEHGSGTVGDVLALRAQVLGAAGIVTDGGARDSAAVAALDIPTFAGTRHPAVLGRRHVPWDVDVTVACGGATVQPGDWVVGDDDGVVVVPPALAEEVARAAAAQEAEDEYVARQVAAGTPVDGLFPMDATWRERYERERAGAVREDTAPSTVPGTAPNGAPGADEGHDR